MSRFTFGPQGEVPPSPMYSFGASADGFVFTAGIVAIDAQGATQHPGDAQAQTRYVLDTIGRILNEKGCGFDDVLLTQIYLKSMDDYKAMNVAYSDYFPVNPPPRFCIAAGLVKDDWLVEIAAIAKSK